MLTAIAIWKWIKDNWGWIWRVLVAVAIVAAVWSAIGWFSHARYKAGEVAGRAQVQERWDAQAKATKAAYDAAAAATQARIESDRAAAQEVERDLQAKLAAADASGRDLGRRLSDYIARARRCAVPAPAPAAGQLDAPGAPGGDAEVGNATAVYRAVEDTLAECKTNAADLDGWYQWALKVAP